MADCDKGIGASCKSRAKSSRASSGTGKGVLNSVKRTVIDSFSGGKSKVKKVKVSNPTKTWVRNTATSY